MNKVYLSKQIVLCPACSTAIVSAVEFIADIGALFTVNRSRIWREQTQICCLGSRNTSYEQTLQLIWSEQFLFLKLKKIFLADVHWQREPTNLNTRIATVNNQKKNPFKSFLKTQWQTEMDEYLTTMLSSEEGLYHWMISSCMSVLAQGNRSDKGWSCWHRVIKKQWFYFFSSSF